MDLINLARAAEIKKQLERLQNALDKLDGKSASIDISSGLSDSVPVRINDPAFLKDLRHLLDKYIEALLEEAKTI